MPETAERANKVSISDVGPSRKKISIEIPAETVDEKLSESMDTLSVEAALPGFRKGRAPRQLIEKRFGSDVRSEARNQLVAQAYTRAVEESKLKVIGDPISQGLVDLQIAAGKALSFEIEVEVLPEFLLPNTDGIAIRKPLFVVTDEMVDGEMKKVCINEGELQSREAPEPGDYLTGHGVMKSDTGTEFYNIEGAVIQVPTADAQGKGMILGVMVQDFAAQLGSPTAGESATIRTKGPENHEVEGIRGADLTITFKVSRIDRIIPAKPEELAKRLGFEDQAGLRQVIRDRMEQRVKIEQLSVMRQQVARYLLSNTLMELPMRLTAQQTARNLERRRLELTYRGVDPKEIEAHMAELRAASAEVAQNELKLFFILSRIAEDRKIKVDDAEINARITQLAMERNVRPDALRAELIQRNQIGLIYQQILDHKAVDAILAKAQVTEMSVEEFNAAAKADGPAPTV